MSKFLVILLMLCCLVLGILAIVNTIRLKSKRKKAIYHTPKLSDLHGKEFSNYIDDLTSELH